MSSFFLSRLSAGDLIKCRNACAKLETEHVNPKPKYDADDRAIADRARYIQCNARFVDNQNPEKHHSRQ